MKHSIIGIKSVFIFFLSTSIALAQPSWRPITAQQKPWSRWWWQGNAVNSNDLTYNLENFQKAGLGGLEITPIYGVKGYEKQFIDFLSPRWLSMFRHTLAEAKRLNLGIDLANASGWPFGGAWVTPEDACKYVAFREYKLKAGEKLQEKVFYVQKPLLRYVLPKNTAIEAIKFPISENKNLQELAIDQIRFEKPLPLQALMAYSNKDEKIDLFSYLKSDGTLDWIAPEGEWTLLAIFQGWHGKMVERAGPGGEGDVIDHFSEKAIRNYLKAFDNALTQEDLKQMRAFFNDSYEVDDARGQSDWTENFFEEFKNRRGYDLKNYLPNLFSTTSNDLNKRVLYDYRTTIGDLILEKYTSEWANWAHAKGKIVRNQAHGSPANTLDLYGIVDIPEIEGTDLLRIKFASSASNVMGKKLTSSESATWENEHFLSKLSDVKKAVDLFLLGGVNHIFYHGTNYSPQNEAFPGWLFYAATHFTPHNPFWTDFSALNAYVARCQSFLQESKPNNDILYYFPITDRLTEHTSKGLLQHFDGVTPEFNETDFKALGQKLLDKGYGFDFISDKQIMNLLVDNSLVQTGGVAYKTILLPEIEQIPLETFEKILALAKGGANIIFHHKLPQDIPGLTNVTARQVKFRELIKSLNFIPEGKFQQAKLGNGCILLGEDLDEMMIQAAIYREQMTEQGLQFLRKKNEKGYLYLIKNPLDKPFEGWVKLSLNAKSVGLYNPMKELKGMAKYRFETGEVYMQMEAGESLLLELYPTIIQDTNYPYVYPRVAPMELTGNWKLKFESGGPNLPKDLTLDSLVSWTHFKDESYKNFSGTATYTLQFSLKTPLQNDYLLDLGKVSESARVSINGKFLGTLLGPTYQVRIPHDILKSQNILQVSVSNSMANRVIAVEKQGYVWQKFYNINMSARLKQNLGKNQYFTTENWQPLESGILGKVMLIPIEIK